MKRWWVEMFAADPADPPSAGLVTAYVIGSSLASGAAIQLVSLVLDDRPFRVARWLLASMLFLAVIVAWQAAKRFARRR